MFLVLGFHLVVQHYILKVKGKHVPNCVGDDAVCLIAAAIHYKPRQHVKSNIQMYITLLRLFGVMPNLVRCCAGVWDEIHLHDLALGQHRNVAAVASHWRHCVRFDRLGSRTPHLVHG